MTARSIFITGASSGIGRGLAFEFAARGYQLSLAARRGDALDAIRKEILERHPSCRVHTQALDVNRTGEVPDAIAEAERALGSLDIVVVNAGIGHRGRVGHGHFEQHREIIQTNVIGAMATCDAAIKSFKKRGGGQLVVISSVAAFRGLPGGSAYSASKAAISVYTDAIRAEVHGLPITVTTIYPGFIDTPINQSNPNRPFLITVERGSKIIADKIERRKQKAVVPAWPWAIVARLAPLVPTRLLARGQR